MLNIQYDLKRRDLLKDLLLRLRHKEAVEAIRVELNQFVEDTELIGLLLIKQALIHSDEGITMEDVKRMSALYPELRADNFLDDSHPLRLLKRENALFRVMLKEIEQLLTALEQEESLELVEELREKIHRLGEFHKHYHRKEKLLFPILERYGYVQPGRLMWENDDRIRALYLGIKRRVDQFTDINWAFVKKRYGTFQEKFKQMIDEEEMIIYPILWAVFNEEDWQAVAEESDAFGYALIDVQDVKNVKLSSPEEGDEPLQSRQEHLRFGGGYLTTEEANLILNNLPLEITFVDKNNVFKYFNEMTTASEMMLVRTPISIGRNVSNCHPPKSLRKVMTLMRDLISQKRTTESMWFKKNGQYIHLTYKALFNDEGEYMGILEYVQDIQPFFELPEEVKMRLSPIVD